jgi:hypothetical protein
MMAERVPVDGPPAALTAYAAAHDEGAAQSAGLTPIRERLAEIKARCGAATRAPWRHCRTVAGKWSIWTPTPADPLYGSTNIVDCREDSQSEANADFVAHAREDIPWLLSLIALSADSAAVSADAHETSEGDARK